MMQIPKRWSKNAKSMVIKVGHKIDQRVMMSNLGFSYLNMAMVTLF